MFVLVSPFLCLSLPSPTFSLFSMLYLPTKHASGGKISKGAAAACCLEGGSCFQLPQQTAKAPKAPARSGELTATLQKGKPAPGDFLRTPVPRFERDGRSRLRHVFTGKARNRNVHGRQKNARMMRQRSKDGSRRGLRRDGENLRRQTWRGRRRLT